MSNQPERTLEQATLITWVEASVEHRKAHNAFLAARIAYLTGLESRRPDEQAELDVLRALRKQETAEKLHRLATEPDAP